MVRRSPGESKCCPASRPTATLHGSRLSTATKPDECWQVFQDSGKDFGYHAIDMSLAGSRYEYCNGRRPQPPSSPPSPTPSAKPSPPKSTPSIRSKGAATGPGL